ncbi:hypothetical protein BDK51DRAFT_36923 [Blyttiomyces helicus]|uniref:Uncharacterized protein n=1 Tax=Blyttiomyces helicus TaxID=388810 RepID=A0A4V1ISL9_9FUNG|nr:hypothetical protein BDK51DRAFT_36923 [Blyttiomyces helicus]|eukprot:RKO94017.1 hypothetical protein BDK51DRAFT_36923 [Blyttiomyces helicus]
MTGDVSIRTVWLWIHPAAFVVVMNMVEQAQFPAEDALANYRCVAGVGLVGLCAVDEIAGGRGARVVFSLASAARLLVRFDYANEGSSLASPAGARSRRTVVAIPTDARVPLSSSGTVARDIRARGRNTPQSLRPLTIKKFHGAQQSTPDEPSIVSDHELSRVRGCPPIEGFPIVMSNQVSIIVRIKSVQTLALHIIYVLEDGTGSFEVNKLLDALDDQVFQAAQWDEYRFQNTAEGASIVKAVHALRARGSEKEIRYESDRGGKRGGARIGDAIIPRGNLYAVADDA